jgi:hypothetical protein
MRYSLAVLALVAAVQASPFAFPGGVTSAVAPKGSAPPGCLPSAAGTFGIAVLNISTAAKHKRQVSTISEYVPLINPTYETATDVFVSGQPQAPTAAAVSTISDGQPQAPKSSAAAVSTISDGQPQAPKTTLAPVTTISDGQPQAPKTTLAPVTTISDGQPQAPQTTTKMATMGHISQITDGQIQAGLHTLTMMPVSQISDGQPQGPKTVTYMPVSVISDGQPQAPKLPTKTACPASQISDGQPQACTSTATANPVSTISDGQPQAPTTKVTTAVSVKTEGQPQAPTAASAATSSAPAPSGTPYELVACRTGSTLSISLSNGILTDSVGRTGYIAANYQFQFDKPPQAGAIYTAGFSFCANGSLALGGSNVFWQCLSGTFYNLYDRNWAAQCSPITIETLTLINC